MSDGAVVIILIVLCITYGCQKDRNREYDLARMRLERNCQEIKK
jgi:hypothetical protein